MSPTIVQFMARPKIKSKGPSIRIHDDVTERYSMTCQEDADELQTIVNMMRLKAVSSVACHASHNRTAFQISSCRNAGRSLTQNLHYSRILQDLLEFAAAAGHVLCQGRPGEPGVGR